MKILHTADWHLGKRLEQFSRLEEQQDVLEEIVRIADEEQADLVIIAGDIFDTFAPSTEAMDLFYRTVKKLSKEGKRPVLAIAGNHDSPDRIEVPNPLARENGIFFAGYPHTHMAPVSLDSGVSISRSAPGFAELRVPEKPYPIRILLTAYANEYRLRSFLGAEDREENLRDILREKWQELADLYCDNAGINILVSHLFMTRQGAEVPEEPDDEKPILHIGGAQVIYSESIPRQIQYVALGHLHRYQVVDDRQCPVVYCGSPLSYSFSEADQKKFVSIVDLEPGQDAEVRKILLKSGRPLKRVRVPGVGQALEWLEENPNSLVELSIELEQYLTSSDRKNLLEAHPGIVTIIPLTQKKGTESSDSSGPDPTEDLETLFRSYFQEKFGQEPNESLIGLFREMRAKRTHS
jgi:exonuclease SbcD